MIPIRCISCGKPVSAYFDEYNRRLADVMVKNQKIFWMIWVLQDIVVEEC